MTSIKIWVLLFSLQLLLQQSGDIELNPGPPGVFHKDELHGYSEGTEEEGKHGVWYMGRRTEAEENAAPSRDLFHLAGEAKPESDGG